MDKGNGKENIKKSRETSSLPLGKRTLHYVFTHTTKAMKGQQPNPCVPTELLPGLSTQHAQLCRNECFHPCSIYLLLLHLVIPNVSLPNTIRRCYSHELSNAASISARTKALMPQTCNCSLPLLSMLSTSGMLFLRGHTVYRHSQYRSSPLCKRNCLGPCRLVCFFLAGIPGGPIWRGTHA